MKKLIGILKQSWFLRLLGMIALSVLIWFLGPLLGIGQHQPLDSQFNRILMIIGVLFLWLISFLWKAFRARQKNKQMLDQLAERPEPQLSSNEQATQEEVQHLDSRLNEAMQALKGMQLGGSRSGGDKQYLYQLPWYIIIGPPGSGKTTLLANSDLQFPLSEQYGKDALHGVGGTRNCDWWFTNDAVLLDTAGRYTTQDSNKDVDHGAWLGFLDLLNQYRGHQPVNGVLIAVSISDLLQLSDEERSAHAKAIRDRIAELYEHLKINIPVYMMFTKSDLLAGFSEFFDDLNKEQREQVWGVSYTLTDSENHQTLDRFMDEFSLLEQRIHQQLLQKMERERSLERRQSMYLFPQQFSSLRSRVNDFLEQIFQQSKFHKPLLLRGVYFTSATQEGSPIDRIMSSLASNFGIARQKVSSFTGRGKSYFINRLLKDVIFAESGLAGTNRKLEQKMQWLQTGLGLSVALGSLLIAGLWFNSYQNNKKLISEYQQEVLEVETLLNANPNKGTLSDQLPTLNKVRQLTQSYTDETVSDSLFSRFGLYQESALREQMDDRYRELLRKIIRPHAKKNLEELMLKNIRNPTALFGILKTYLYMGGKAPENTQPPVISDVDWDNNGQPNDRNDAMISKHFNALLKEPPSEPIKLVEVLVNRAREVLSDDPAKLAYIQLKNASLINSEAPDFRINEHEGLGSISSSFQRKSGKPWLSGIPGLYTKRGFSQLFLPKYNDIVKNLKKDRWVLGDYQQIYADSTNIRSSIQELYQRDYINAWSNFLRDLTIKPLRNTSHAPEILRPLTPDSGNLISFILKAVKHETDFSDENNLPLIGNAIELKKTLKAVDHHFKPLHKLLEGEQLKEAMQLVDDLYKGLYQDISGGKDISGQVKTTLSELNAVVDKLPEILRVWLLKPIGEAKRIVGIEVTKGATRELIKQADEELCAPCKAHFKGKFPFKKYSNKNIDISEFNNYFAIGGTIDSFAKANLKTAENIKAQTLKSLNELVVNSDRIRRVFFSTGNLNISFSLQLIRADPNVHSIVLSIGTTKNSFSARSGRRPKEIYTWPASPIAGVVTYINPAQPPKFVTVTEAKDQWGLFKLVKNDQIRLPSLGNAIFSVHTPTLRDNPFKLFNKISNDLKMCKCPQ